MKKLPLLLLSLCLGPFIAFSEGENAQKISEDNLKTAECEAELRKKIAELEVELEEVQGILESAEVTMQEELHNQGIKGLTLSTHESAASN